MLAAGAVPFLGLGLPRLLAAEAARGASAASSAATGRAKSCIFIFQYGGLSQLDSWDPKPDGPSAVRGPYKPISTSVPGFFVGELMPRLARLAHKYTVIRSMSHHVPVHDVANRMLLAGQSLPSPDAPSFGAIVSKLRPSNEGVPSHVWLQKFGGGSMPPESTYLTGGVLGAANSPLLIGVGHEDNPSNPAFRVNSFDMPAGLTTDRARERLRLLGRIEADRPENPTAAPLDRMRERAADLLEGSAARRAFDIDREDPRTRDRYGRHPLGQNLLMARRLIEAGVRLVSVVGWCGLAPGDKFLSIETWDMHGNAGIDIFGSGWNGLGWALPCCDQSVSALLEDLDLRGLLDETLVVLVGEFGRTARISKGAAAVGRDHWPHCYSAMLAGAGVRGGYVHGRSDKQASYVMDRPVPPEDFAATLLHAMGIPPETPVHPDGFSTRASTGRPVTEVFL
ncbi:MAG: DUF1501 domain-containing protein [Isosphaeraceae bacterium]